MLAGCLWETCTTLARSMNPMFWVCLPVTVANEDDPGIPKTKDV